MLPEGNKKIDEAYQSVLDSIDSDYERGRVAGISRVSPTRPPRPPRSEAAPAEVSNPTGI